jgi:hypothetical protein
MIENLISEQNITDLADLMKVSEQLPAGADARIPRTGRADGGVHATRAKSELLLSDLPSSRRKRPC